jgi:hypothetical protein
VFPARGGTGISEAFYRLAQAAKQRTGVSRVEPGQLNEFPRAEEPLLACVLPGRTEFTCGLCDVVGDVLLFLLQALQMGFETSLVSCAHTSPSW